jgi:hypothetical protein
VTAKSDLLFQFMRDRAHDLAALDFDDSPTEPFPHADPYLLSSTMQKAIRRRDTAIARRAGHQLYTLDRARLWRRLAVVALEDIGIADVTVAAELVGIATWPAARRLIGGDSPALDIAIMRACRAAKDRTGDHLASIIGRETIPSADRVALRTASPNALLAMIASSDLPWERRLRAAVILLRPAGYGGQVASGRSEDSMHPGAIGAVFDVLHELGVPCQLLIACEAYAARQRDPLPVLVPFAAMLCATGCTTDTHRVVTHDLPPAELIGALPAYALDPVNTRIGKRAVELWLRSYLAKPQWLPRQVAACLWNAESAACDRTLSWPLGDTIRERAYAADLSYRGLPVARHAELADWIDRERPALTAARQAAFDSAVRQSGKLVEANFQTTLPLQVPQTKSRGAGDA